LEHKHGIHYQYLASEKVYGWFRDISDQAGFSHDRRSFLNHQIEISGRTFGAMAVSKDIVSFPLTPITLRKIEQLRRTILGTLIKIENNH